MIYLLFYVRRKKMPNKYFFWKRKAASVPFNEKKTFVDAVWPKMDRLQAFHDQHKENSPMPDEVVLFDMMAEAAAEAYHDVYGKEE